MLNLDKFGRMERRILNVLMDGLIHSPEYIISECMDPLSEVATVYTHIANIRKKLKGTGLLVNFVKGGGRRRAGNGYMLTRSLHHKE